jgi:nucleoside-diphosphate-sugar epimerase
MDVLLVGGTGLISTAITRQLVDAGHDVTLFNRGESDPEIPDVERIEGNRYDDSFRGAFEGLTFDAAIDMICYDGDHADAAIDALGGRIEQFVFCSTVDVYERPAPVQPITEDAARAPVTGYAEGKIAAEDRLLATEAFETTVIRPWHTYGESRTNANLSGSIGDAPMFGRMRAGLPIVVHGDGTSMWGACHREDVARAFVNALGNETAYGETYHVTSEEPVTQETYHRRIAAGIGAPEPEFVYIPTDLLHEALPERTQGLVDHFQYSTVFDNSKARRDLDFEYTIPLEEGARRGAAWLDERDRIRSPDEDPEYDRIVEAWREASADFVDQFD